MLCNWGFYTYYVCHNIGFTGGTFHPSLRCSVLEAQTVYFQVWLFPLWDLAFVVYPFHGCVYDRQLTVTGNEGCCWRLSTAGSNITRCFSNHSWTGLYPAPSCTFAVMYSSSTEKGWSYFATGRRFNRWYITPKGLVPSCSTIPSLSPSSFPSPEFIFPLWE